jgi:Tfp pilus assembly protein PilF
MAELDPLSPDAFLRKLANQIGDGKDPKFAFLLGAGCSVTSGIPAASTLAEKWLRRLKRDSTGTDNGWDEWGRKEFQYTTGPGQAYSAIIKKQFSTSLQQQLEIETVIDVRDPIGFGYITLATLMTDSKLGRRFDVVLTTNFDDLLPDSLYLYTKIKPRVVPHEALSAFVRPSEARPLIVKLHGDARLGPKNTAEDLRRIGRPLGKAVSDLLKDRGLIIMGYSGNDIGVASILSRLPKAACPWGIYWVNASPAGEPLAGFLAAREAKWVQDSNFDRLMALFFDHFALRPPDMSRLTQQLAHYTTAALSVADAPSGQEAIDLTLSSFRSKVAEWSSIRNAWRLADVNAEEAANAFVQIVTDWDQSAVAHASAAWFYCDRMNDSERAQQLFERSLELDPLNVDTLTGTAWVAFRKGDAARAEQYYEKAVAVDPKNPRALSLYGWFLAFSKRDHKRAEDLYRAALKEDPSYHLAHKNYGFLLQHVHRDIDAAEYHLQRAVEAKPDSGVSRSVLAVFLNNHRGQRDRALRLARQSLLDDPSDPDCLANYAMLLYQAGKNTEARAVLDKLRSPAIPRSVKAEVLFYRYAHDAEERDVAFAELKQLLADDVRSEGWDFTCSVEAAVAGGHPDPAMLRQLAKVVSGEAALETLESGRTGSNQ